MGWRPDERQPLKQTAKRSGSVRLSSGLVLAQFFAPPDMSLPDGSDEAGGAPESPDEVLPDELLPELSPPAAPALPPLLPSEVAFRLRVVSLALCWCPSTVAIALLA